MDNESVNDTMHILKPKHCFCEVSREELRPWVDKKYNEHIPTVDLINSTTDPHQKEIISIVALLDVDEETVIEMMGDVDKPTHHIIHCRENVRQLLGLTT